MDQSDNFLLQRLADFSKDIGKYSAVVENFSTVMSEVKDAIKDLTHEVSELRTWQTSVVSAEQERERITVATTVSPKLLAESQSGGIWATIAAAMARPENQKTLRTLIICLLILAVVITFRLDAAGLLQVLLQRVGAKP